MRRMVHSVCLSVYARQYKPQYTKGTLVGASRPKWLGRQYLFQTFEDDTEVNVAEIRQLLDEENESDEEANS